jgi:hypothetical protein
MAAAYLNVLSNHLTVTPGNALVFQDAAVPGGQRRTLSVPIDREGNVLITYAGRWTDGPFPYLSFVDVWDAIQEGREAELREQVAGRAVLIVRLWSPTSAKPRSNLPHRADSFWQTSSTRC